jgi:hypothetical protein
MGANPKFDLEFKKGQIAEEKVRDLLLRCRVEVKADKKAWDSGNVCVEYAQRDKDGKLVASGIALTESQWYCFAFDDDTNLFISTEKLKRQARFFKSRRKVTGDNGNVSILVPISSLIPA